jgi:hypothetical protein
MGTIKAHPQTTFIGIKQAIRQVHILCRPFKLCASSLYQKVSASYSQPHLPTLPKLTWSLPNAAIKNRQTQITSDD